MRKSISWRGLNKLIRFAEKCKKWRIPPLLGTGEKRLFLLFIVCLVLKKLLTKEKLNLYSGFLIRQYDFTQLVLLMIFIKFENRDKRRLKTEQAWFLLLQWVEKTNGK